jgi:hypothetical protein
MGATAGAASAPLPEGRAGAAAAGPGGTYFLQHWCNLWDPQPEDALYDSEAMRRFAGPDSATTWFLTRPRF